MAGADKGAPASIRHLHFHQRSLAKKVSSFYARQHSSPKTQIAEEAIPHNKRPAARGDGAALPHAPYRSSRPAI